MKIELATAGIMAAASVALAACDREVDRSEPVGTVSPPSTTEMRNERQPVRGSTPPSVQAIADARCAREARCNNIGPNQEYASQEACMTRIQAEWQGDLSARECPQGINQGELNECLEEIRNSDCGNPIEALGRIAACRPSDICND